MWRVEYSDIAEGNLLALDKEVRNRILKFFRERIALHPEPRRLAESLHGELRGLWKFRFGNYRAICDIQGDRLLVLVLEVGHRSEVYR